MNQYILEQRGVKQMARYLMSGSHGFIGTKLCLQLEQRGHKVDRLERKWFVIDDNYDYIIHLASYGNMYSQQDRNTIFEANVMESFRLLECTKDMPYKKFVYISSSSVELQRQTLYSACKKAVEELISAYDKPIIIVRPYSVTGVGEQREHLIPTLIDAAFSGKEVSLVFASRHDFIDVADIVNGIIHLAQSPYVHLKPQELGSALSHSNKQVLDLVQDITGKTINVKQVSKLREYDSKSWVSPHKWSTKTLAQSIKEMVDEYQK